MLTPTALLLAWLFLVPAGAPQRDARENLAEAQKKWAAQALQDYEFTFRARCFCPPQIVQAVTFRVTGGRSVLTPEVSEEARKFFEKYETIEQLFAFIHAALERKAHTLVARYDQRFGYPRSVEVDYVWMTKDEEMAFTVSDFRALGGEPSAAGTPAAGR